MGTDINPYGLHIPSPGESGVEWGPKVAENFIKLSTVVEDTETAVAQEVTDRGAAIAQVTQSVEDESDARTAADDTNLNTATGRAVAFALIFGA